ncbi:hypothetical protein J2S41_005729 [Catenuloplanes atrovinosus]|uniref:Uncharacterized protein n=1 Tax=Catenuloplanes atrovinosus TaxID=137266 RepID=A0AAE4CBT0_9ACTN|nr:hypothetical protein [Catenuloplanes atrovinosus]
MSTNRMYWGVGRLGDGDTVPVESSSAGSADRYRRRGYAAVWALLVFGATVLGVVLAASGR